MIRYFILSFLIVILTACTTETPTDDMQDKVQPEKTAKINAQLGIAYLEKHQVQIAKQKLLMALNQGPNLPETWYSMAYFYEATGNKEEANTHYLKALEIAPTLGDAQNNYGTFLCRSGHYRDAIKHFMLATQDSNYLYTSAAYENAGLCAKKIPNKKLAIHFFETALTQEPDRPTSLLNLAQLNYELKKFALAKTYLNNYLNVAAPNNETIALNQQLKKELVSSSNQLALNNSQKIKRVGEV